MGEIADDCYDRALDELDRMDYDPDYYESGGGYGLGFSYSSPRYYPAARKVGKGSADDFDALDPPDDFSDLV